jgi:hypothetical protein
MSMLLAFAAALGAGAPPADNRPVWHYVRSNSDGSEAEDIVIFRRSDSEIDVIKMRARCTDAALVTAEIDPVTGVATRLVGGRLQRDGGQRAIAWLEGSGGRLIARIGAPDAPPMFDIAIGQPWHLYDFDFSDLIARPPAAIADRADFSFELPLLLVSDDGASFVNRGEARLQFVRDEMRGGVAVVRYTVGGPAFGASGGTIWFAAQGGHIVEARMGLPNHSEYRDFQLLLGRRESGEQAWRARIDAHWQGCPPE